MKINVQASHDKRISLEVGSEDSLPEIKQKIINALESDSAPEEIRLIFSGKILKENDTIESLRVKEGNTIHMVRTASGAKPKTSTAGSTTTSATTATPSLASTTAPPSITTPASVATQPSLNIPPEFLAQMMSGGSDANPIGANQTAASFFSSQEAQSAANMLQNPEAMRQMFEVLSANPQLLQAALQMNPSYRNAPPHVRAMLERPEYLRMAMELSLAEAAAGGTAATGGTLHSEQDYMQTLNALLGGTDSGAAMGAVNTEGSLSASQAAPVSNEPPEVRFSTQLQQLNEMGFWDADENIRALLASNGNVNLAIERLLRSM